MDVLLVLVSFALLVVADGINLCGVSLRGIMIDEMIREDDSLFDCGEKSAQEFFGGAGGARLRNSTKHKTKSHN